MIFVFLSPDSKLIPMKKLLFLVLFMASAILGQAQVSKMLGQWNTFDDKTGDMRSCVNITEKTARIIVKSSCFTRKMPTESTK